MKKLTVITYFVGAAIMLLAACQELIKDDPSGPSNDPSDQAMGNLVIRLTDAPFPVELIEKAEVIITKVEIRHENDTGGYPFMTLLEDTLTFDLLELRNGVTAELLDTALPTGTYDLVRLYVHEASLTIKDMDTYHMKVPSGAQTGIKIFIDPAVRIKGGLTAELLLDFCLEKSFVMKGNMNSPAGIKGFNFKPVIRAVNQSTAGSIEGIVMDTSMLELPNASVWIEQDSVIANTVSDSAGFYALIGIPEGYYSIYATKENYDTVSFENVEIVAGNKSIQDFTLTPQEP
jgi:hypothetical protein